MAHILGLSYDMVYTWTSRMPNIIDPMILFNILPILSTLGSWAILLGTLAGPGTPVHTSPAPRRFGGIV